MEDNSPKVISDKIPFYRDVRFLKVFFQILFIIGIILLAGFLYSNMLNGLSRQGIELNLTFLNSEAGFELSEGIDFEPSETFLKAFWVGIVNTLKVSILGIFSATAIGFFFGIARLSSNWLIRQIASVYVECFRNIPLVLQIVFWYAIMLVLPVVRESISFFDSIFINVRGVYLPALEGTAGLILWLWYLLSGIIIAIIVVLGLAAFRYFFQSRELHATSRPSFISNIIFGAKWVAAPTFLIIAIVGWFLTPEVPFELSRPEFRGFNFVGGMNFSPEFTALLIGLAVYTSAFIAEVVRSGIQAVVKGQREAARSVGLKESQVLRLVVVPQAIPVIVPPLTSQYLNLAKNSSLAIFIGFPDLFQVGEIMMSQTGQSIPIFAMIMVSYLIMSLTTSAFMNWYNHRITRIGRSR
ncbi:ABC transporter permease subunit [Candidatus Poribacteria bacterium]|nr:ABC transporter permease subunit [Candidatus Poribacteria bacterium]